MPRTPQKISKPKPQSFYEWREGPGRFVCQLTNEGELGLPSGESGLPLGTPFSALGTSLRPHVFPSFRERPRFLIDTRLGRAPRHLERMGSLWIVSDSFKTVAEVCDPSGLVFSEIELVFSDGKPTQKYWLCDVTRVLEVVDQKKSSFKKYYHDETHWTYDFAGGYLLIDGELAGSAKVFRVAHIAVRCVCSSEFKAALDQNGIHCANLSRLSSK